MKVNLSYVLTTYNKIEFLKVTLALAIQACQPDEEIVVVDGGSTDGTGEYLKSMMSQGKIHQFISEKDFGEAHGTNKAMLMARGELLKIITDDDVYYFPTIAQCKKFMLENSAQDVLVFDGYGVSRSGEDPVFMPGSFITGFKEWTKTKKPFLFSGLSLMIRKSSLAYLGLLNPMFKIVDMEYSMRISSLHTRIAFFTGLGFVNIVGPESNSVKFRQSIEEERIMVRKMYVPEEPSVTMSQKVKNIRGTLGAIKNKMIGSEPAVPLLGYAQMVKRSLTILEESNCKHPGEILTSES